MPVALEHSEFIDLLVCVAGVSPLRESMRASKQDPGCESEVPSPAAKLTVGHMENQGSSEFGLL